MQEVIQEVPCRSIRVSPFQPRRTFAESEIQELADSIQAVGLIHPPVVREVVSSGKLLYYELIAGERRWRACIKAGQATINVLIRNSSDEHAAKSTLIENIQRVDLDPIEMARAFKRLIDIFRMTQEEVADKVGKKRSTVANYLRLLSLPDSVKKQVSEGKISMGHAKTLLSLGESVERSELSTLIEKQALTVREAEEQSRRLKREHPQKRKSKTLNPHLKEIEELLQARLGTKVQIDDTQKGGRLIIQYYGNDDLDRLLNLLRIEIS